MIYPILSIVLTIILQLVNLIEKENLSKTLRKIINYSSIILVVSAGIVSYYNLPQKEAQPKLIIQNNPLRHDTIKIKSIIKTDSLLEPILSLTPGTPLKMPVVRNSDSSITIYFQLHMLNNAIVKNVYFDVSVIKSADNVFYFQKSKYIAKSDDYLKTGIYRWFGQPLFMKKTDTFYVDVVASYKRLKRLRRSNYNKEFMITNDDISDVPSDKVDTVFKYFSLKKQSK